MRCSKPPAETDDLTVLGAQPAVSATEKALAEAIQAFRSVDLGEIQPPLESTRWAMDRETLCFLVSLMRQLKPRDVVEFGTGLSTSVLAWALNQLEPPGRITSVDHDPRFIRMTRDRLQAQGLKAVVSFVCAPLVARKRAGRMVPVYHFPGSTPARADLILVDAPPKALGGREGMLYQAMDFARPGTLILLDDANRAQERNAVARWRDVFAGAIRINELPGFPKGLVAITVVEQVPVKCLPQHELLLVTLALKRLIEPSTTWIVVDDGQLNRELFPDSCPLPFLERNGEYWGPAESDDQAIHELDRLRQSGARFLAFVAWTFWWQDHYRGFHEYLESHFDRVSSDEQVVVFDLQGKPGRHRDSQ